MALRSPKIKRCFKGAVIFAYPEGFGNLLRAGTEISISMHYNKEAGPGTGVWDRSGIGIKFYPDDAVIDHKVTWNALGVNGAECPMGGGARLTGIAITPKLLLAKDFGSTS